jgi:hypothetical protein
MRVARDNANANTTGLQVGQSLEIADATLYAGQTVTLSYYARKGANYSATSDALVVNIFSGTSSTETNRITTAYASGGVTDLAATTTLTSTLTRFSHTITFGASVTQFAIKFTFTPTGTAGAADYYEIGGVQLEVGNKATPFTRVAESIQGELAAAQRYYQLIASGTSKLIGQGYYFAAAQVECFINLPVEMRTTPTISIVTGTSYYSANSSGGGADAINSLTIGNETTTRSLFLYNDTQAAGTAGQGCRVQTNNAAAFIAVQAEL